MRPSSAPTLRDLLETRPRRRFTFLLLGAVNCGVLYLFYHSCYSLCQRACLGCGIDDYSAPLIRRDLRRYDTAAGGRRGTHWREIRDGYESLDRVLVLGASRAAASMVATCSATTSSGLPRGGAARDISGLTRGLAPIAEVRAGECGKDR